MFYIAGRDMFSWNIIGILIWVAIILYLVFIVQNIRQRRIKMIIKQHKRFSWPNMALNIVEIVVLLLAAGWMFNQTLWTIQTWKMQTALLQA